MTNRSRLLGLFFVILYILVAFVFVKNLDSLGPYSLYIFEAAFLILVIGIYRRNLKLRPQFNKWFWFQLLLAFIFGFTVYRCAAVKSIVIPFNLADHETMLFLLLIGPILEELLFRQALWSALQKAADNRLMAYVGSSILFAFGHFYAYYFVPDSLHPFIIYQTLYVLIIALWWGAYLLRNGSIIGTIFFHLTFNLGFFAAFKTMSP